MYEAFFSLEDSPFVLTPDPRFLLRSKGHHAALSTLIYGITSQKGLMALIGDVGTGKTLLCRALLRELPKAGVQTALVLNPYLSDAELLGTILDDLGVERGGRTKGELMSALSQYLLAAGAAGKTVVVILDEAQQMSITALEQIRILSTLETATRKLLQIVLVGQPELQDKLERRQLRQLEQRIGIRCYLRPLSRKETFRYVEHRLRVAGLSGVLPFPRSALNTIHQYTRGIPRVINLVCDRALTVAFTARAREVTPALVKAAIRNLEGDRHRRRYPQRGRWWPRPAWSASLVGLAVAGVLLAGAAATVLHRAGWGSTAYSVLRRGAASWTSAAEAPLPRPVAGVAPVVPRPLSAVPIAAELTSAHDGLGALLAQVMRLWGVNEDFSEQAAGGAWPVASDGMLDIPVIAARYQLSATSLPETSIAELEAVNLPAILALRDGTHHRPYLLRWLDGSSATLISPAGGEMRLSRDDLASAWTGAVWVIWRNLDLLPADPSLSMSPAVIAALALRLQQLGLLTPPVPTSNSERFEQAVKRFQISKGLTPDGIVGPRTTLALARVVAGRFGPRLDGDRRDPRAPTSERPPAPDRAK